MKTHVWPPPHDREVRDDSGTVVSLTLYRIYGCGPDAAANPYRDELFACSGCGRWIPTNKKGAVCPGKWS